MRMSISMALCLAVPSGCGDVVEQYATLQDAVDHRLLERGWFPNLLPESANRITISTDLDTNVSRGGFFFNPSDFDEFISRLQPYSKPRSRITNLSRFVDRMQTAGYRAHQYSNDQVHGCFSVTLRRVIVNTGCGWNNEMANRRIQQTSQLTRLTLGSDPAETV